MRHAIPLLLTLVCTVPGLRADALTDLTAQLKALKAQTPITLKLEQTSTEWDEGKEKKEVRTLKVAEGPGGLKVLEDSGAGGASRSGKAPGDPTAKKGDSQWRRQLRAQEDLLEELEKATLVGESPEVLEGRPVRRLRLKLNLDLDEEARKHLKRFSMEATLWLGADGLPVAMERHIDLEVRAMIFVKVWTKVDSHYRFVRVQDRLITIEATDAVEGEAMGHAFKARVRTQATPQP